MFWHIFKKDLRLLWIAAAAVAAIQLIIVLLRIWLGLFQEPAQLSLIAAWLGLVWMVGVMVLCVSLMHQDAVPGDRQDWLVRPIARGQLILSKLLFVALVVQTPILMLNLGEGLCNGFAFMASLTAALSHNVSILCLLSLPALIIGVVTRTLTEAFLFIVAGVIAGAVIFMLGIVMLMGLRNSLGGTGLQWLLGASWELIGLVGAALVITIQFFKRKTTLARCLIGVGATAILLMMFLPWPAAFAIQQQLSKEPGAGATITLTFNPQLGPFVRPPGSALATGSSIYLPLHVTGVPPDAILLMDRAQIRVIDSNGKELFAGRTDLSIDGPGSIYDARLEVRRAANGPTEADAHQRIFLPAPVYATLRDQSVNISVDYSLTLYRASAKLVLPADNAQAIFGALGWCATRIDGDGDDVQVRCMNTIDRPKCFTAFLEFPPGGLRNPETHQCGPDYSPVVISLSPTTLSNFGGEVPFFDRSGLTHYPVDGTKLADARLVIDTYEARDHFTRKLDIPNVQLSRFVGN